MLKVLIGVCTAVIANQKLRTYSEVTVYEDFRKDALDFTRAQASARKEFPAVNALNIFDAIKEQPKLEEALLPHLYKVLESPCSIKTLDDVHPTMRNDEAPFLNAAKEAICPPFHSCSHVRANELTTQWKNLVHQSRKPKRQEPVEFCETTQVSRIYTVRLNKLKEAYPSRLDPTTNAAISVGTGLAAGAAVSAAEKLKAKLSEFKERRRRRSD